MSIQVSGVAATAAQLRNLRNSQARAAADFQNFAVPLMRYKRTGTMTDFGLPADGGAAVVTFPTVPADAIGIEVWLNQTGSTDYLFAALVGGRLSNTGVLASNVAANLAACRSVTNGAHMVLPFVTLGALPSTFRFASGNASSRIQGAFITAASNWPYLCGSTTEFVMTGAAGSQQLPYTDTGRFPVGYVGAVLQVVGSGVARFTVDGTIPSATVGDILAPGTYFIDLDADGIALSALRIYLPTGTNIVGNSLMSA